MHEIDYEVLIDNLTQMINLLEFDAMRSAGKAKLNSQHLEALYGLKDRYEIKLKELAQDKKEAIAKLNKNKPEA